MRFFLFFLTVLLSSALFALGIPNEWLHFGYPAGFSALIPFYYVLLNCGSYRKAALLFGVQVVCVHVFSSFWLVFFGDFAIFTLGASSIAYFFLALPFGMFFYHALQKGKRVRMFAFAGVWLMWEYFKSNGFVAYPWGTVAMTAFYLKHFIQFADTAGVWGISFVLPLFAACAGEAVHHFAQSADFSIFLQKIKACAAPFLLCFAVFVMINVYGFIVLSRQEKPRTYLNTVIVQQNGDPWDSSKFETYLRTSQSLSRFSVFAEEEKPDLIVWSESALSVPYTEDGCFYENFPEGDSFLSFLSEVNTPLLAGTASADEQNKSYNSAVLIDPSGRINGAYAKIQLVVFAEYMPLIDNPFVQKFFDKLVGFSSGWTPGSEYKLFSVYTTDGDKVKFTAPICFEDAFPSLCANLHNTGGEVLINITNDSWSKTASAEYQHFVISFFRAIELRTGFVRSTNSGFSCVVDAYGTVLSSLPLFTADAATVKVPIYHNKKTAYALLGDWLPALIFIILMKMLLDDWICRIKKEASAVRPSCRLSKGIHKRTHKKSIRRKKPLFAVKKRKRERV